ncbi:hypothetical protein CC2G_011593 [Coprinopsis cinerea AmutBmut pab1-1]|nr:hypothetical protein CC2G_011593 [Coprinopsis cinerea AmutBmut pab1-1]
MFLWSDDESDSDVADVVSIPRHRFPASLPLSHTPLKAVPLAIELLSRVEVVPKPTSLGVCNPSKGNIAPRLSHYLPILWVLLF